MKRYLSLLTLLFLSLVNGYSQDVDKHKAEKEKIEKEIAYIDNQIALTQGKQKTSTRELNLTQAKIDTRKKLIKELDSEIASYDNSISSTNRQINDLQKRVDTLKVRYQKLVLNTYKNRDSKSWFMHVLASENLNQGYRRYVYLRNISEKINNQAKQINNTERELVGQRAKLNNLKSESVLSKKTRENEFQQLTTEEKNLQNTISQLKRQESNYRKELSEKQKEVERLNTEIEKMVAEAVKQQQSNLKKGIEIDYKLSENFDNNKGKLPWPVKQGVVVEKYGQHNHPVFPNIKLPFNNGVNISTDKNAEVFSVFDGVVVKILVIPGYNQCVMIQHGVYFTFYCKLNKVSVKIGDKVKTGTPIGSLEEGDGDSILHFELWNQSNQSNGLDPEKWLR